MAICQYYSQKIQRDVSRTISGGSNSRRTIEHEIEKCSHPESQNKPGTMTANVSCQGMIENCIIPEDML